MLMPHKPKLGQNFLVDDAARHAIVDALGDISQRAVIEVGPGLLGRSPRSSPVALNTSSPVNSIARSPPS